MRDALLLGTIAASLLLALRYPYVGVLAWAWFSIMNPHQMAYGVYGLPLNAVIAAVTITSFVINGEAMKFRGPHYDLVRPFFGVALDFAALFTRSTDFCALLQSIHQGPSICSPLRSGDN